MNDTIANSKLDEMLARTAAMHKHLCPRQVLGVRMGLYAGEILGIEIPQADKRLIAFVETDGCFADGVSAATGCTLGHRTMRLVDYGKVAVTLVDSHSGRAVRIAPRAESRKLAVELVPEEKARWKAQLQGYQRLADKEMFDAREVQLKLDVAALVGKAGTRVNCAVCGEEILNQREVLRDGQTLCQSCAGESYWRASVSR